MPKFSVKRPYFVLVVVILLSVIGGVSFSKLKTDLLPPLSLPYMVVVTTYPGASPEKVENDVTKVVEKGIGTVSGVEKVTSNSSENYSMVTLQFADDTDLDSAMVRVSSAINQLTLPENAGKPMVMEVSMDMVATMQVSVDYEGKDIYDLSSFVETDILPAIERQEGVAKVDATGIVEKSIEVRLDQAKIDEYNEKVLAKTNKQLAKAKKQLEKAEKQLEDGKKKLEAGKDELATQQESTSSELAKYSKMLNEALALKEATNAQVIGLRARKMALVAEKQAYEDNHILDTYRQMNDGFAQANSSFEEGAEGYQKIYDAVYEQVQVAVLQAAMDSAGMNVTVTPENAKGFMMLLGEQKKVVKETIEEQTRKAVEEQIENLTSNLPVDVKDAIDHPKKLESFVEMMKQQGMEEQVEQLTTDNLKNLYDIVENRIPKIDEEMEEVKREILVAKGVKKQIQESIKEAEDKYAEVESGKITAAAAFGASQAQMENALKQIEEGEKELENSKKTFKESTKTARENANLDQLLNMETLSGILTAENFSMPAGYINAETTQYLLKVGDTYETMEQLENTLLVEMDGIGEVRLGDVATISIVDNSADSYAKVNGNPAVILAISKSSTAGTADVAKDCVAELKRLESKFEGLHFTILMNQGDYINLVVKTVLSNLIWGAVLAVLVLLIFLRDPKPTLVVAFSIPLSVMFAVVLMYFTDMSLNIISLSGLALGIGMLVDNSIVVVENIYRYRDQGVSAARAAVLGANQVAGAIFSSTLTTICVFLPIVFTSGMTRELMQDMCLTIAYSLSASLVVALLVVPAMSSKLFVKSKERKHRFFDAVLVGYEKILRFCLKVKVVPLMISILLLAFSIYKVTQIGLTMMPSMGSEQMTASFTMMPDTDTEEDYALADEILESISNIEGVDKVGVVSGSLTSMSMQGNNKTFSCLIILEADYGQQNKSIAAKIESLLEGCSLKDFSVSESNMDMSALMGSGAQVNIYGMEMEQRLKIADDVMEMFHSIEGFTEISNGQEDADQELFVIVDKDKAMKYGLTVAQVYAELASALTTEKVSTTLTIEGKNYEVAIVDTSNELTEENLMSHEFETTVMNEKGEQVKEIHTLDEFATYEYKDSVVSLRRENLENYISVTATTEEGYNTTLLCRDLEKMLDDYETPEGYTVEIQGESETVNEAMEQMILMIVLAIVFIYFIMVAQFQSLLSPFIVLFTMPLAFTGGLIALLITGEEISVLAMMGFLVLAGVVVNNGIVFVDYANQLRLAGKEKREALVETGKTRMRPILMTALTTILAMSTMAFSNDMAAEMGRGMAIVTIGGLSYATLMTLFIVPVMYDIFYRKEMKAVDLGDEETLKDDIIV